jgi:DNA processing protein
MDRDELAAWLTLQQCPGIGPVKFRAIAESIGFDLRQLLQLDRHSLAAAGLKPEQINAIKNPPDAVIKGCFEWLDASPQHHLLTQNSPDYPELLRELHNAPPLLYAIGRLELLSSPQIAIIGSRNCSPGGASSALDFSAVLAQSGFTITSGMALGIDSHAHRGALDANGNTIAVIGTGIDRIYPSRNKKLAHEIAAAGLVVSDLPLGAPPNRENFPRRNRIISGLSLATLVVEATRNSGSLITARLGLEQGREVFAIPGSIHNPQVKGCHQLIRQGAKLVEQASDIIEDLGSLLGLMAQHSEAPDKAPPPTELDEDYQRLLEQIGYDPVPIETLLQRSGLTIDQLSSMLLILELQDHIQTAPGGLYMRC